MRAAGRDHHVVDRLPAGPRRTARARPDRWRRTPRCCARRRSSAARSQALGIAAGEDHLGPLGAGSPGRLEPDAGAAADHDDGLAEQLRLAARVGGDRHARSAPTGASAAAISPRSAFSAADVDLRERRERLDRVPQHVERDAGADRQRRLLQPLAGLRPERVGAGQPLAVAEQRQEAVALGVGARVGRRLGDLRQIATVALKRASAAPTAAACGSV